MTIMQNITEAVTLGSLGLTAYHHAGYPFVLKMFQTPARTPDAAPTPIAPSVTIVMPAYNEAHFIAEKIRNLAALDYPAHRLRVVIVCDGCTDSTAVLARAALVEPACAHLDATVISRHENRGKVAVMNEGIGMADSEIVVVTDVSAMLPTDALRRATAHFSDPRLGAVGGTYKLRQAGCDGESVYWSVQRGVKRGEAALGAPLGLHGAFYAFRRVAWSPLPADTINDDFILPMEIFSRGWRVAYDEEIVAMELEAKCAAAAGSRRETRSSWCGWPHC